MKLVGRFRSPFVRRVAIAAHHYGLPFEHLTYVTAGDEVRAVNPLGRVPALILDDGSAIIDSNVILDYLDSVAPQSLRLVPAQGPARWEILSLAAIAIGTMEKMIEARREWSARPADFFYKPRNADLIERVDWGMRYLDSKVTGQWLHPSGFSHADIATASFFSCLEPLYPELDRRYRQMCPRLAQYVAVCEQLSAFRKAERPAVDVPQAGAA
jgi:glutathione S-transferase